MVAGLYPAAHAETPLLIIRAGPPTGIKVVPATTYSGVTPVYWQPAGGQHVIPRYANGVTHPAGQLIGWGPTSVVQGTVYGPTDGMNPHEIVVTEDYTLAVRQWVNGTGSIMAVVEPEVRDLTILGKDDLGNSYGSGGQVNGAYQWNPQGTVPYNNLETGLYINASGAHVENVGFYHIAGTCAVITRGGGVLNAQVTQFDDEKSFLNNIRLSRSYSGLELIVIDMVVGRVDGMSLRDWGIKVPAYAGAVQFQDAIHLWGVSLAPLHCSMSVSRQRPACGSWTTRVGAGVRGLGILKLRILGLKSRAATTVSERAIPRCAVTEAWCRLVAATHLRTGISTAIRAPQARCKSAQRRRPQNLLPIRQKGMIATTV